MIEGWLIVRVGFEEGKVSKFFVSQILLKVLVIPTRILCPLKRDFKVANLEVFV